MPRRHNAPPRSRAPAAVLAIAAAASLGWSARPAAADAPRPERARETVTMRVIPDACRELVALGAGPRSEQAEWERGLSFAACLQDAPLRRVSDPAQLEGLVDELTGQLELSVLIYLQAITEAPPPVQLRAVFHIGLAHVALITRARAAVEPPPELADDAAARALAGLLRARLEPLLERPARAALVSFEAIHEAARHTPALARDEVGRGMIRAAAAQLAGLRGEAARARELR